jgi:hypothetical protein
VRNNTIVNTKYQGIGVWAAKNATVTGNTMVNVAQSGQGGVMVQGVEHNGVMRSSTDVTISGNTISVGGSRPAIVIRPRGLDGRLTVNNNRYAATGSLSFADERSGFYGGFSAWQGRVGDSGSSVISPLNPSNYSGWTPPTNPTTPPTNPPPTTPPPTTGSGNGLLGQYFNSSNFTNLALTRRDGTVNFNWGNGSPASQVRSDNFTVRWTGQVLPTTSGNYTFYTRADDGVRLWVDGKLIVNNWTVHPTTENSGTVNLTAGKKYNIKLEYFESGGGAVSSLHWSGPGVAKQVIPQSQLFS